MRIPVRLFPLLVAAAFALALLGVRQAGLWKDRQRSLPVPRPPPAAAIPAPGGFPL